MTNECLVYRKSRAKWVDHRWKDLDVITTLNDGTRKRWETCQGCGRIQAKMES